MWFIWLGIIVFLALIEVMTVSLTTIWFVMSGIIALLLSFFIDNFFIQFAVFVILGILLLCKTRTIFEKWFKGKEIKTNIDRIIGMEGIVTLEIKKNTPGEVKVDGKSWTAVASKKIKEGATVQILEIDGVKVKVEEV